MVYTSPLEAPSIPGSSLCEFVFERAKEWPEHTALLDGVTSERLSYGELIDAVARASAALRDAGIGPGSVVALVAANQPQWLVTFYAAISAGGALTPINPAFTVEEIATVLRASRTTLVVVDAANAPRVREAAAHAGAIRVVVLGGGGGDDLLAMAAVRGSVPAPHPCRGDDLAALPFSSGTTGLPKGVALSHRNLIATLVQHQDVYHLGVDDVVLAFLPLFHIYGMSIIADYALRHGATVVTLPRFHPATVLTAIEAHRVTALHMAPPTVHFFAGLAPGAPELASVRFAMSGAAPLGPGLQARAELSLGCRIGQGYGLTEASPGLTFVPDDLPGSVPRGTVGVLVAGTEARIVDPVTGVDLDGPDATGELWIRGPQVMTGYADNPEATASTIVEGGWLRTGDIARVDSDGWWYVVDRLKELIKYKGWQIAPAELEAVLMAHGHVSDAAVVGIPDADAGEIPVGYVVADDTGLDADEVLEWVATQVAPYKRLRALRVVDELPKSAAGKLLRKDLRSTWINGTEAVDRGPG